MPALQHPYGWLEMQYLALGPSPCRRERSTLDDRGNEMAYSGSMHIAGGSMKIDPYTGRQVHSRRCHRRRASPLSFVGNYLVIFTPLFPRSSTDMSSPPLLPRPSPMMTIMTTTNKDAPNSNGGCDLLQFEPSPVVHRRRILLSTSSQVGC
jgi:hypothetical protein